MFDQEEEPTPPLPRGAVYVDEPALPALPPGAVFKTPEFPKGRSTPSQGEMDTAFRDVGNAAAEYAPGVLAALAAATQPEMWPAIGMGAVGALAGSGVKQGTHTVLGSPKAPKDIKDAAKTAAWDTGEGAATEFGGQMVAKPLQWAGKQIYKTLEPHGLYQSALKPRGLNPEEVKTTIGMALKKRIPASGEGYQQAVDITESLNKRISDMIEGKSEELGAIIDPRKLAKTAEDVAPIFEKQVDNADDLAAIEGVKERFLKQHSVDEPYTKIRWSDETGGMVPTTGKVEKNPVVKNMTASQAQAEKQGTYRQLRDKAYGGELKGAEVEMQKRLARGLRDDLGKLFPGLNEMNAEDKVMIDLEQQLSKFVLREGNKQKIGLTESIVSTGHGGGGAALAFLKRAIDNPEIKSKLAIALYHSPMWKKLPGYTNVPKRVLPNLMRATTGTFHALDTDKPITIGSGEIPGAYARGGRMRDPLQRTPGRAATLRSLRAR